MVECCCGVREEEGEGKSACVCVYIDEDGTLTSEVKGVCSFGVNEQMEAPVLH
jgi:hypothetical protein